MALDYDQIREQLADTDKRLSDADEAESDLEDRLGSIRITVAKINLERRALRTILRQADEPYTMEEK